MNSRFLIEICSDVDFEGMVVDVSYDMQTIASINYDKGVNSMEIEIAPYSNGDKKTVFPLTDFLEVLERAKKIALRCAQEDQSK